MAMGALICFNCCITEQPQPKRRRPRIDRSMIGEPTNFRHTAHVGSGDVMSNGSNNSINNIQDQMSSKGTAEETASPIAVHLNVIDLPARHNS